MRKLLLILSLLVATTLSAQDKKYHGDGPDDVLQYVPFASVFALKALGVESESSWKRMGINVGASYVLSAGVAWVLKHTVKEERPDGTDDRAFPSGHFWSTTKRCMNAPSMPYSFIHRKCVSTVE